MKKQFIKERYERRKSLAEEAGVVFKLTYGEFAKIFKSKICAFSGERFNEDIEACCREVAMIDPSKGYIKGNVVAVKQRYNFNCPSQDKYTECFTTRREALVKHEAEVAAEADRNTIDLVAKTEQLAEVDKQQLLIMGEVSAHTESSKIYKEELLNLSEELSELDIAEEGCKKLQKLSLWAKFKLKRTGKV